MFNLKSIILFLTIIFMVTLMLSAANPTLDPDCPYTEYQLLSISGFLSIILCALFLIFFGFFGGTTACGIYLLILIFFVETPDKNNVEVFAMKNIQYNREYNHQTKEYDTLPTIASWEYDTTKFASYTRALEYKSMRDETDFPCIVDSSGTYFYLDKTFLSYLHPGSSNYKWYYGSGGWIYNPDSLIYPPLVVIIPWILGWAIVTKGG